MNFSELGAMARLSELVALEYGTDPAQSGKLRIAAAMHDIGKLKISAAIINKPGKLTLREFEIVKTHTVLGAQILKSIQGELGEMARMVCLYHHENYDGKGYLGMGADDIPKYVQAVTIADVYTALLSERPYKRTWSRAEALGYIRKQSGTQFDPVLVEVFLSLAQDNQRMDAIFGEVEQIARGH